MRTMFKIIVAVLALTVIAPGYADEVNQTTVVGSAMQQAHDGLDSLVKTLTDPIIDFNTVNKKEADCLAKNIFFEAGNEPEEGMVAVGLVTLNRVNDGRFRDTVCGVVDQKLSRDIPKTQIIQHKDWFKTTTETQTIWSKISICQFSWRCMFVKNPKNQDERWLESQRIAKELLASDTSFEVWRDKYATALYFHSAGVRPPWIYQKEYLGRIGGHKFYAEKETSYK